MYVIYRDYVRWNRDCLPVYMLSGIVTRFLLFRSHNRLPLLGTLPDIFVKHQNTIVILAHAVLPHLNRDVKEVSFYCVI